MLPNFHTFRSKGKGPRLRAAELVALVLDARDRRTLHRALSNLSGTDARARALLLRLDPPQLAEEVAA